ncbi:MAG: ribulose-phosphate 3-epimerase [Myxococcales bacterium]|nr:ribulose-phosphate 3-epimerase [Myxococcales bacterium]
MPHAVAICPSILSADFANLANECAQVTTGGADMLHVDVMDGRFVPNLTIGAPVVGSLAKVTSLPLDCHLMVHEPDHLLGDFAKAGAKRLSVHIEACRHLHRTVQRVRSLGMSPGVAVNPHTSFSMVEPILREVDFVLVMSVNPGFGGQSFIGSVLDKVRAIDDWRRDHRPNLRIQIDGGITVDTIGEARQAGVDWFVAGSAIFGKKDRAAAIAALRLAAG